MDFIKELINQKKRQKTISQNAFDYSWMEEIKYQKKEGIFFIASGFFMYFTEEKVQDLLVTLAQQFPAGHLMFDISCPLGNFIANKRLEKEQEKDFKWHFNLKDPKKLVEWSENIRVVEFFNYWEKTPRLDSMKKKTKRLMNMMDCFQMVRFVRLEFI